MATGTTTSAQRRRVRPRIAGERPGPRPSVPGTRTWPESVRELAAALTGLRGSPAAPHWLPTWVPAPLGGLVGGVMQRVRAVLAWWKATRVARAQKRFSISQGGLLCGGLAYTALFALFAALAIGYTIFMAVLGGNERLRNSLLEQINTAIPGLIDMGDGNGAIDPNTLLLSANSLAGIVAALVLLWSALSFMGALRRAVRTMLGFQRRPVNFFVGKVWDLGGFLVLLVAVLASTIVGIVATSAASWFVRTLNLPSGVTGLFTVVGLVVSTLIDLLVVIYVLRVMGGSRAGWADTLRASAVAAVALGVLRFLGTSVIVGSASKNALLAGFAALVTILLLVNFVARLVLLVAAWLSDPPPSDVYQGPADAARTPATLNRRASASGQEPAVPSHRVAGSRPAGADRAGVGPEVGPGAASGVAEGRTARRTTTAGPRPAGAGGGRPWWSRLWSRARRRP